MVLQHKILDARPLTNPSYTAAVVAPILTNVVETYGLTGKIHVIVRDGGMSATTRLAGFESIWCFAHILNRVGI